MSFDDFKALVGLSFRDPQAAAHLLMAQDWPVSARWMALFAAVLAGCGDGRIDLFGLVALPITTALASVIAFEAWRSFPFAFLFITARLEGMPDTLEEAATVDA